MTLNEFIKKNWREIEDHIAERLGHNSRYDVELSDDDLEDWIMNDETLYNWALANDVDL